MKFRKLKFLGAGSYGSVHLAAPSVSDGDFFSKSSSSLIAVKSAIGSLSVASLEREKKFLDELVGSPYIVQPFGHDISIEKGLKTYNLMMEFAPGGSLKGLIKQKGGRIQESEVACYTEMLLQGLSYAHKKGIMHCDMKPDNILVFPVEERYGALNHHHHHLKIADFGLARKVCEKEILGPGQQRGNRGAVLYASPESIIWGIHEAANDVWALGCTVFEMITGEPVWRSNTRQELMGKVAFEDPKIPEYVSTTGRDFVEMCLEKDPAKRMTIPMLLRHRFITSNSRHLRKTDQLIRSRNPLGSDVYPLTIRTHTFSDGAGEYAYPKQQCHPYLRMLQETRRPLIKHF